MPDIKMIYEFAKKAHEGHVDKLGRNYFEYHVKRVADKVIESGSDAIAVALLHDVIEDTDYSADDLLALGIPENIVSAVVELTRPKGKTYHEYIKDISNVLSVIVKLADLETNMDIKDFPILPKDHFSLLKRYHKAYRYLIEKHA